MSCGNTFGRGLLLLVPITLSIIIYVIPEVYGGFACLSNPCVHGVCLDDLNTTYSCYCIDGYTGVQCQTNWDECWSAPCQNGGVCIDGIATFNCSCAPGYVGELCEEDFNECESNPCLNNGTCTDALNGYNCTCPPGYSGIHCEIDIAVCNATNETRCSNGGVCVEGPGISFECKCRPGWDGFLCDTEIDECMSAPCLNGAVCIDLLADYACACLFGYTGRNCEEKVHVCEDNPCRNGALCLMEDGHATCYCVPDFHGELCQYQYDECQLGPRCMNGGTCIDGVDNFTCSCPPRLTGVFCECLIVDSSTLDCTYVSPTTILSSTPFSKIETPTTSIATAKTGTFKTLETEITEVPNASTTLYYSSGTTTASSSYPTTVVISLSTETTSGSINTTVFEVTTETTEATTLVTEESSLVTQEVSHTTEVIKNVTTTESVFTTTRSETTQTTTAISTVPIFKSSTQKTTQEPYSTEYTTQQFDLTSSTTQFTARTLETSSATTIGTTEILTVPITLPPNVTQTTTTAFPEETTFQYITEETTLLSSIAPFLTSEPSTTEGLTSSTFTLAETNQTTTTVSMPDCASGDICLNGGTCVYTAEGYRCVCPFDTEGLFCEVQLGIKNAAFGGDSFLSHRLINHTNISFDFKARTLSSDGLVFYWNVDSIYMMLYLENGHLMFKFSCGYQTMLLSELGRPVNDGFDMHIKAKLDFTKDLKFCNASLSINDTLKMTGDQIARTNKLITPEVWLYLGGIPQDAVKNNIHMTGFVGCMKDLRILGKSFNIFRDAEDGSEITECSSLICLSNPCRNGATCVALNESWTCQCKNGYLGKMCEKSVCDNNPCLFGGTCLPFTSSGYICLCPFGKHGHFCENGHLEIMEPNFSSTVHGLSSYAAYPIPSGISQSMEIRFKFVPTTMDQISILMFLGQKGPHDLFSDHMAVSFVKGYVMLTWNLGSGPRRIFTTRPINKNQESYLVRFGHLGRRAWLYVDDLGNVTGRSPGNFIQLDVFPLLYLGGHDSLNFSTLPHDLPLHVGFSGCIFDVQLKSGSVIMPLQVTKQVIGRAVGQCETTECYEQVCHNEGACLHHGSTFMCLCQDDWFGPLCSSRYNPCDFSRNNCTSGATCFPQVSGYECDCPIEKTGKFCEIEQNLTDVSFTGKRSFLSLGPIEVEPTRFNIEFQLRPLTNRGVVLFIGSQTSFLCLLLHNSFLELTLLAVNRKGSAEEPLSIRSNKILTLGNWYKVQIGIYGRKVYLAVDNILNTGLIGRNEVLNISDQDFYLGGLPDLSVLAEVAVPSLPVPFTGCLRLLSINSRRIALNKDNIKSARNIADCDGTPCGGDFCENGGSCWLDSNLNPLCLCQNPYFGDRCEKIPDCGGLLCKNGGRCINSRCICTVGWSGVYCETAIEVKIPKFKGTSYLIVETDQDKKRELNDFKITSLYLNFSTPQKDGLIVWSSKDNKNFVGVGMERGYLKFCYSSSKTNQSVIEMPSVGQINDGLWHTLLVVFKPFYFEFDDNVIQLQNNKEVEISTDGLVYLGGMNNNQSMVVETGGIFNKPFQGCIDAFGVNDEEPITDFSGYEGENVDVCGLF